MAKLLILIGITIALLGVVWKWTGSFPLGNLPGDIQFKQGNTTVFLPLGSCLAVSATLTLLSYLWSKF